MPARKKTTAKKSTTRKASNGTGKRVPLSKKRVEDEIAELKRMVSKARKTDDWRVCSNYAFKVHRSCRLLWKQGLK